VAGLEHDGLERRCSISPSASFCCPGAASNASVAFTGLVGLSRSMKRSGYHHRRAMLLLVLIFLGFASLIAIMALFLNPPEAWVKKFFRKNSQRR
jgi:hypothetical protein